MTEGSIEICTPCGVYDLSFYDIDKVLKWLTGQEYFKMRKQENYDEPSFTVSFSSISKGSDNSFVQKDVQYSSVDEYLKSEFFTDIDLQSFDLFSFGIGPFDVDREIADILDLFVQVTCCDGVVQIRQGQYLAQGGGWNNVSVDLVPCEGGVSLDRYLEGAKLSIDFSAGPIISKEELIAKYDKLKCNRTMLKIIHGLEEVLGMKLELRWSFWPGP